MYVIIWEYKVKVDHAAEFEKIYGQNGASVELFRKGEGYLGTELLRDSNALQRYITIDRWISSEAYDSFRTKCKEQYEALDSSCEHLTEHESLLGTLVSLELGG